MQMWKALGLVQPYRGELGYIGRGCEQPEKMDHPDPLPISKQVVLQPRTRLELVPPKGKGPGSIPCPHEPASILCNPTEACLLVKQECANDTDLGGTVNTEDWNIIQENLTLKTTVTEMG